MPQSSLNHLPLCAQVGQITEVWLLDPPWEALPLDAHYDDTMMGRLLRVWPESHRRSVGGEPRWLVSSPCPGWSCNDLLSLAFGRYVQELHLWQDRATHSWPAKLAQVLQLSAEELEAEAALYTLWAEAGEVRGRS